MPCDALGKGFATLIRKDGQVAADYRLDLDVCRARAPAETVRCTGAAVFGAEQDNRHVEWHDTEVGEPLLMKRVEQDPVGQERRGERNGSRQWNWQGERQPHQQGAAGTSKRLLRQ